MTTCSATSAVMWTLADDHWRNVRSVSGAAKTDNLPVPLEIASESHTHTALQALQYLILGIEAWHSGYIQAWEVKSLWSLSK